MLYTHHVTHAERALLARTAFALPLLSPHDAAHARADAVYAAQLSCVTGHNNTGVAPACTGSAPCWPAEVHWTGTGYGKYPFWGTAGPNPYPGPGCEPGKGGAIETFWSQPKKSEKYIHASCDLSTFSTGLTPNVGIPCNHLFVGWSAWLYTPDESYCCMSGCGYQGCSSLQDQVLTSPQSDWMKRFTYQGVADGYAGDYHSGRVKNYTLHVPDFEASPVAYFWYLTDMDGTPVEQGEGPQVMPRAECGFGPAYIYHQYGNFTATSLAASTFDIPAVCKNTTNMCVFK